MRGTAHRYWEARGLDAIISTGHEVSAFAYSCVRAPRMSFNLSVDSRQPPSMQQEYHLSSPFASHFDCARRDSSLSSRELAFNRSPREARNPAWLCGRGQKPVGGSSSHTRSFRSSDPATIPRQAASADSTPGGHEHPALPVHKPRGQGRNLRLLSQALISGLLRSSRGVVSPLFLT